MNVTAHQDIAAFLSDERLWFLYLHGIVDDGNFGPL